MRCAVFCIFAVIKQQKLYNEFLTFEKNTAMNCIYNIYNKKVVFDNPSVNWNFIKIKWIVEDYSFVKKEEVLGIVEYTSFHKGETRKEQVFNIVSPSDGYFYVIQIGDESYIRNESNMDYWDNKLLACVFDNSQEFFSYYYCCEGSKLETDPYTGLRRIVFNYWDGFCRKGWEHPEKILLGGDSFRVEFYEDKMLFCFDTYTTLKIGDCISLLFDNGNIIDFPITTKPVKQGKRYKTTFVFYQEDVEALEYSTLISYRISFKDESIRPKTEAIKIGGTFLDLNGPEAIRAYIKNHLDAIKLLVPDYQLPRRTVAKTPIEYQFNWCYVYLMRDNTNSYHKIGISNKPEYREKTLQSEKPSIEMLACKKFPTRKIAEAIESALHTAYSQQRVRGEWFNLNDEDVAAIIETLK